MSLSPEDRKRIYEEEKARLEIREQLQPAAPPKKKRRFGALTVITLIIIVWAFWSAMSNMNVPTSNPAASATLPALDKSAKMQAERQALIQKLVNDGYFTEVVQRGTAMPRVWVTPKFTAGNFKDKEKVISVVYAFHFDGTRPSDSVAIIDAKSGNEIGRYGFDGLRLK